MNDIVKALEEEICFDCIFYRQRKFVKGSGTCRFNPPTIIVEEGEADSCWPIVNDNEWCGKFKEICDE